LGVLALVLLPFVRLPGPQWPGINGFFSGAVFLADLATSFLLFLRFRETRAWYVLVLAGAYLHTATMALAYVVTFPAAIRADGPLLGSPQSVSWIFLAWTLGYALFALAAVILAWVDPARVSRADEERARFGAMTLTLGISAFIVTLAVHVSDFLPSLVNGAGWTGADVALNYLTVGLFACGILLIIGTRLRRSELLLWLAVALAAMLVGNALSAIGGGRYTIGWYASRLSWTASACALVLYFVGRFARQQDLLVHTTGVLEERTRERDRIWNVTEDLFGVSTFGGYFLSANPAWTRLLGWTEAEITATHVNDLRHPDDAAAANAGRARLAEGEPVVRLENRFRHKDGSWRWIAWTLSADQGLIYIAGRDVTAENEAVEALRKGQANQAQLQKIEALGQLTGGVAHDFNNLLMIIGGNIPRVRKALIDDPKATRAVEAMEIAANRGKALTRQLLSFSRRQAINPRVTPIAERIEAVQPMLASSIGSVALGVEMPADLWPVKVDTNEFDLALVNLMLNARDALSPQGVIRISARNVRLAGSETAEGLQGDFVAVSVADDGEGIPPDILPRVFDPFFTTKQSDKGSGLGLSQVHGFSRQSGGTAVVASELGKGTTVTIYLPRTNDTSKPRVSREVETLRPDTVLLVEDNPDVAEVTRDMLAQLGYRVHAANNAQSALEMLGRHDIGLVFSDLVMAGPMDGIDLARSIRAQGLAIPVMLATGYSEKVSRAAPDFTVLRKPFDLDELRSGLSRLLTHSYPDPDGKPLS
jgi:PAS domain S-box-containing protein